MLLETVLTICVKSLVMLYGFCIYKVATCQVSGREKSGNLYFKSRKIDMFEEKSEKIEIQLNPTCYFKHPGERKKYFEIAGVLNDWGANPRGTVIDLSLK